MEFSKAEINCSEYVDVLIPSKDRPMQLHLLLESMGKRLTGIGRITITWQGSSEEYAEGYELLKKRVSEDDKFSLLRKNSKEIIFRQRGSLREVYDAALDSGASEYILPLVDDDIFTGDYNLVSANASRYFFCNSDVITCSLRLGDNLSSQVSHSLGDGVLHESSSGHGNSLLMTGRPRFLSPIFGHLINENIINKYDAQDYMVWSWAENLNVPHWSCFLSVTGQIYRKSLYLDMLERFGKENFLQMEAKGMEYCITKAFPGLKIIEKMLRLPLKAWSVYLSKRYKLESEDILRVIYCKYKYRTSGIKGDVQDKMVSAKKSVVLNLDLKNSHNRKMGTDIIRAMSVDYGKGRTLDYDFYSRIRYINPLQITDEYKLIDYSG